MKFLLDEHVPRSLAQAIRALDHDVDDVRDIGLRGRPDADLFSHATKTDAIIITRDRGFSFPSQWPEGFTSGVIFIDLASETPADVIVSRVTALIGLRLPVSLQGALTMLEPRRALSRQVRKRPKRA